MPCLIQQNKSADGIVLRTSNDDPHIKARSTVEEAYTQIIADAKKAADLMNQSRGVEYATKEAAGHYYQEYIYIWRIIQDACGLCNESD